MQVERREEDGAEFLEVSLESASYRFEVVGDDEVELVNTSTDADAVQADRPQSPFDVPPEIIEELESRDYTVRE